MGRSRAAPGLVFAERLDEVVLSLDGDARDLVVP
jgi:hypothetical protein